MKCPYQKSIIHQPEYTKSCITYFAKDIETFADCCESECPFYRKRREIDGSITEHCKRAESEE